MYKVVLFFFTVLCQRLQDLNEQYHSSRAKLSENITVAVKKREEVNKFSGEFVETFHIPLFFIMGGLNFWHRLEMLLWFREIIMMKLENNSSNKNLLISSMLISNGINE